MRTEPRILIESLSVEYASGVRALDEVNLEIGKGLFGLLGPNGAGKTTLMRTLATLQQPASGRAVVSGHDVQADATSVRQILGYLPQDFQTYQQLKTHEVLDYYAILNGISSGPGRRQRIEDLLQRVGLWEVRARRAGQLSGGMLRRLGVAQALLNDPRLLILDEPTVGLDPAERIRFRVFLGELSRDRVVILSTHIVPDIGSSCERLAVLDRGRIRFVGKRGELIRAAEGKVWRIVANDQEYERLSRSMPITSMVETAEGIELRVVAERAESPDWQCVPASLEDAYLWTLQASRN